MARVTNLVGAATSPLWIWDITTPVGQGLDNQRADVQLVQALINEVRTRLNLKDPRKRKPGPVGVELEPLAELKEDGWWGPETAAAVQSYQESANARRGGSHDGRVDPVYPLLGQLNGDPISNRFISAVGSVQRRTIFHLNTDHLMLKGRLMDETEFPSILRAEIQSQKV